MRDQTLFLKGLIAPFGIHFPTDRSFLGIVSLASREPPNTGSMDLSWLHITRILDTHSTGKGTRDSIWGWGLVYPNRAGVWHKNSHDKVGSGCLVPTAARMEHLQAMLCALG